MDFVTNSANLRETKGLRNQSEEGDEIPLFLIRTTVVYRSERRVIVVIQTEAASVLSTRRSVRHIVIIF